jgi:hypothetical protein
MLDADESGSECNVLLADTTISGRAHMSRELVSVPIDE